jgi:hypothetical protein
VLRRPGGHPEPVPPTMDSRRRFPAPRTPCERHIRPRQRPASPGERPRGANDEGSRATRHDSPVCSDPVRRRLCHQRVHALGAESRRRAYAPNRATALSNNYEAAHRVFPTKEEPDAELANPRLLHIPDGIGKAADQPPLHHMRDRDQFPVAEAGRQCLTVNGIVAQRVRQPGYPCQTCGGQRDVMRRTSAAASAPSSHPSHGSRRRRNRSTRSRSSVTRWALTRSSSPRAAEKPSTVRGMTPPAHLLAR